jgi:glycosyltransferase involved in cell wall biosynthesis
LFTYKRNDLLPRAVKSLLEQSFTDWVCELHNDCPGDEFPGNYIRSLLDDRFYVKDHAVNLGGTASFNLAFAPCEEQYATILEDDNWWNPDFLATMVQTMDDHPEIDVAWSNMHIWDEQADGNWKPSGQTIWPDDGKDVIFTWPQYQLAFGALHSNSAMIYRGTRAPDYLIPENCIITIVEGVRERAFKFPILLKKKPIANFSRTIQTSRPAGRINWVTCQILLLGSFVSGAADPKETFLSLLAQCRHGKHNPINVFFLVALLVVKKPSFLKYFSIGDWLIITRWVLRNGYRIRQLMKLLREQQTTYNFLLQHTMVKNKFAPADLKIEKPRC